MKLFKSLIAAFAVLAFAAAPIAAVAQENVILFIDNSKLLMKSKAGQSISKQVKALAIEAEKELKAQSSRLETESEKLKDAKDSLSKEDFGKRYQALIQKAQQVTQLGQIKKAEVSQAEAIALSALNTELQPVVEAILKKRKATVLLERRSVIFANDDMDITDEIIKALDKKVKTIKVTKVDLIAEAAAAQAAKK